MWICPVCETSNDTLCCAGCGFDGSINCEEYPTLCIPDHIPETVSVLRERMESELKNLMHCPICRGHWFSLDLSSLNFVCRKCGHTLPADFLGKAQQEHLQQNKPANMHLQVIDAGDCHTVRLFEDGTAAAVGMNSAGQCDLEDWSNIIAITAGGNHTVGLKVDGTVVAAGGNSYGQTEVERWKDIVSVSAGSYHTLGLKKDGTAIAVGNGFFESVRCEQLVRPDPDRCRHRSLRRSPG